MTLIYTFYIKGPYFGYLKAMARAHASNLTLQGPWRFDGLGSMGSRDFRV